MIELTPGGSTQLLSGYRGSGKTTQLRRLRQCLADQGYVALLIDVEDYLNVAVPVDIVEFLVALAYALDDAVMDSGARSTWADQRRWWERLGDFVGRVSPREVEIKAPLPLGPTLKADLRASTAFADRLRTAVAGSLSELVAEVRDFARAAVAALLNGPGQPSEVVLLVDSLEHFRGTAVTELSVQASIEQLFGNHADKLQFHGVLGLHVVYTVPPYLKVKINNLASLYEPGAGLQVIPSVKVQTAEGAENTAGLLALERVLTRRGDWQEVLGPAENGYVTRICAASGGHMRDLLRIMREVVRRARRADSLPVAEALVTAAIDQLTREMLPIADDDAAWLWRVHLEHAAALPDIEHLPVLARFLDTHLVLVYRNGREWYDVHPLVLREVEEQMGRLDKRRKSDEPGSRTS